MRSGMGAYYRGRDLASKFFLFVYKNTAWQNSLNIPKWDTKHVLHLLNVNGSYCPRGLMFGILRYFCGVSASNAPMMSYMSSVQQ